MRPRLHEALWLVGLVGALAGGCQTPPPAAPPAPTGDDLNDLDALVAVGQVTASIGREICARLSVVDRCTEVLDALDDGLTVAAAALASARVCQESGDAECVAHARQTAHDHLPELRRLVSAALGGR